MPEIAGGCDTNEVASGYLPIILFACEVILLTDNFEDFLLDHGSNFQNHKCRIFALHTVNLHY